MSDVMLDLETMGTDPNAAIISIGAIAMNLASGELGAEFYRVVDLASAAEAGGVIDPQTVQWWLRQERRAQDAICVKGIPIEVALTDFSDWLLTVAKHDKIRIWGDGAAFDNVILASAYRRLHRPPPWRWWNDRCYRTIKNLYPQIKATPSSVAHHALEDARAQARHLIAISTLILSVRP